MKVLLELDVSEEAGERLTSLDRSGRRKIERLLSMHLKLLMGRWWNEGVSDMLYRGPNDE